MYMFESKCLEHNSKQTRAKFSVLFKVHFFRPAEDSSLPISASNFDFFSLQYHHKTHCLDSELVSPGWVLIFLWILLNREIAGGVGVVKRWIERANGIRIKTKKKKRRWSERSVSGRLRAPSSLLQYLILSQSTSCCDTHIQHCILFSNRRRCSALPIRWAPYSHR